MGFIIKKIVSAFIMPLGAGLLLGLVGLFMLYRGSLKKAKLFLTLSFASLILASYGPVANGLIHTLESRYSQPTKIDPNIEYVLLLGGDFEKRGYGILEIYHQNSDITIVTSGYKGAEKEAEAILNKQRLIRLGVPETSIVTQEEPQDTRSEASTLKERIGMQPFYLVSSAYHLPRAMAIFKKVGLDPTPYPIGHEEEETNWVGFFNAHELDKTEKAVHEYIGLLWSLIKGDV